MSKNVVINNITRQVNGKDTYISAEALTARWIARAEQPEAAPIAVVIKTEVSLVAIITEANPQPTIPPSHDGTANRFDDVQFAPFTISRSSSTSSLLISVASTNIPTHDTPPVAPAAPPNNTADIHNGIPILCLPVSHGVL